MNAVEKWLQDIWLNLSNKAYSNPRNRIEQLLDLNGDGSGTTNMVDDTPKDYYIAPPPGEAYVIKRINIYVEEGVGEKFDAAKYGATAALSNGIIVKVEDENGNLKTLTPLTITKIGHWDLVSGIDMFFTDFAAAASDLVAVRWTFAKGGGPICLIGDNGEKLVMEVNDNLGAGGAALVAHYAQVQGFKFRPPKWWSTLYPKAT